MSSISFFYIEHVIIKCTMLCTFSSHAVHVLNTAVLLFIYSGFGPDWWQTSKAARSSSKTGQHCQHQHPAEAPAQLWTGHSAAGHTSIVTYTMKKTVSVFTDHMVESQRLPAAKIALYSSMGLISKHFLFLVRVIILRHHENRNNVDHYYIQLSSMVQIPCRMDWIT